MKKILFGNQMSVLTLAIVIFSPINPLLKSAAKWIIMIMLPLLLTLKCDSQQLTENFNEATTTILTGGTGMPTGYATGNYVLSSGTWAFTNAGVITTVANYHSAPNACVLKSTTGAAIVSPNISSGGVGTISFWASNSSGSSSSLQVGVSTDGVAYTQISGSPFTLTTTQTKYTVVVNNYSTNLLIRFYRTSATVYLDDILVTAAPSISYYWNGSNIGALNGSWNNSSTNWSSPTSQNSLNAVWPVTGTFSANFNSATVATTVTIPTTITTMPNSINIGSNFYTLSTAGTTTGSISSPINLNGNLLTLSPYSTANLSLSGMISGTGGLSLKGGGVGNAIGGNIVLSAANSYSGNTSIGALNNNAQLQLDPSGSISTSPITVCNNSQLYLNGTTNTVYIQGTNALSINGIGNVTNLGAFRTAINNTYTWNGAVNVVGTASINVGSSGTLTLPGILNLSTYGLIKEGSGTLILSNSGNNGTGLITINNGTLKCSVPNLLFNGSVLAMVTGSVFDIVGNNETIGALSGTGTITSSTIGNPTLTIGSDNSSTEFGGVIQNGSATSIGLIKTGKGILTLSGINTFSGTTNVNSGTLNMNGSLAIGNNVTIISTGTLIGSGVIKEATTIGGIVSPNSIGAIGNLNTGNTILNAGGTYYFDINSIPSNGIAGINWDNLVTSGILNNATSISPFNISINGTIVGFNNTASYTWQIGSYKGMAPSINNINILTTGLTNNISGGSFAIAFENGNINLIFNSIIACSVPISQPTALVFGSPSSSIIPVSFTSSFFAPSGYLVVRTINSTAPSSPIDGVVYTLHSTSLGGYIELDSNSISFTSTSLISGTNYWYWVFAYNNLNCSGGPVYQSNAPLSGMATSSIPTITTSQKVLSSFGYSQGYGPSNSQYINLSANNLSTSNGNIIINGTSDYLLSTNNNVFVSTISLPYSGFNLAPTQIYVQLKPGLLQNYYNEESIIISGGGAISVSVQCNGIVTGIPLALAGWDMNSQYLYGVDSMPPTTISNNVTVVGPSRGLGVGLGGSSVYNAWGGNGFMAFLPATGISNNAYLTFSIQSHAGFSMSLSAINPFYYRRSGTGPTSGLFQYQIDNNVFVSFDTISFPSSLSSGALLSPINLNGIPSLQNVSPNTKITFRLVPYNGSSSIGTFYIFDGITGNDFSILGSLVALKPLITSNLIAESNYGVNASYQIIATNVIYFSAANLPAGMTIDSMTGIINVSNNVLTGNYPIVISASNQGGTTSDTLIYSVNKVPLIITAISQIKTYGNELVKDSLLFTSVGLINKDTIQGINWFSDGIICTALPNCYSLIPSVAFGIGMTNYNIIYVNGQLTVNSGIHGVWVGVASTLFKDTLNWQDLKFISASDDVVIHTNKTKYPILNDTISLNNLTMDSLTSLLVNKIAVLKIAGSINNCGFIFMNGTIEFNGLLPQTIPANCFSNNTINNLSINNISGVTILGQLNIKGTVKPIIGTLNTSNFLTLISDSNSTARIASGNGNYLNGLLTVQRYITQKKQRKYSFIGSSIAGISIRNSWQQQIYITGNGFGGQTCGTTLGDGSNTDKYNSNGFDKTQNNTPSMFYYNAEPINGSRWVSIKTTDSNNLILGMGYKVNIRGDRNNGISCDNQLNQINPNFPDAVTLSANGIINMGNIFVALNDTVLHKYTLISNPYPSQISFSNFQLSNSIINNKFWTYSPFGNGNYSTCCEGVYANQVAGYTNLSGDLITSGQAFFVEANANGNLIFGESNKVDNPIPNTKYFGTVSDRLIRIGLLSDSIDNRLLDEVVLRFNKFGSQSYNNKWDAVSFSCSNQVLSIIKDDKSLSIATYPDYIHIDTIQIALKSSSAGSFKLFFNNEIDLNTFTSVILIDKFLNISTNISNASFYSFNITNDTMSDGKNRFELIVSQWALAVHFVTLNVKKQRNNILINWQAKSDKEGTVYIVEHSIDGIEFKKFYQKYSNSTNYYNTLDSMPFSDVIYYRIKAINLDGSFIYSPINKLNLLSKLNHTTFALFPNPVHGILTVKIEYGIPTDYSIEIQTVDGKLVLIQTVKLIGNQLQINTREMKEGIYFLKIKDNKGMVFESKFVKN